MNKKFLFLILPILFVLSCGERKPQQTTVDKGRYLYDEHCAACHGVKGDGQGPTAKYMWPKPRDFTKGVFKYRTTRGPIPSDHDILQTMKKGIPGSSMPGWDILPMKDWKALLAYVKTLVPGLENAKPGQRISLPTETPDTPQSIQEGRQVYESTTAGCVSCHGNEGHGDGKKSANLKDIWGDRVVPRDLTRGPLKWGDTKAEIYRSLMAGIPGTPMPGYEKTLTPKQLWSLVHYLKSIQKIPEDYDPSKPERFLIKANKISGDLPLDYRAVAWTKIKAVPIFLKVMWADKNSKEWIMVKALNNGKDIAFYLSWEDKAENNKPTSSDGVALQFPIKKISEPADLPYLGMGSASNPVQIWEWTPKVTKLFESKGVRTLISQDPAGSQIVSKGIFANGQWHVVIKRPLKAQGQNEVNFGSTGYVAFALWDGESQKHTSPESFSEWMIYEVEGSK